MELQKVDLYFSKPGSQGLEERTYPGEFVQISSGERVPHYGAQGDPDYSVISPTVFWVSGYDRLLDFHQWTIQVFEPGTEHQLFIGEVSLRTGPTPCGEEDVEFTVIAF